VRRPAPARLYVAVGAIEAFAGTLAFTITNIYRFRTAGLDAFQLVLVGTAMEASVLLFEIPTGVVADIYSRKASIIIGHLGMGAAFLLEATFASFAGVLVAQVLCGLAYTFTSGATVAWVTTEMEEPDRRALASLFLRASRWGSLGALVAVPLSFALAAVSLRLPLVVAGAVSIALGLVLVAAMAETQFRRADADGRSSMRQFADTVRSGANVVRRSRVLLLIALFIGVAGGASEAFDRFTEKHLLDGVGVPTFAGRGPLFTLAVLFTTSSVLGVLLPRIVERFDPAASRVRLTRWLIVLTLLQVVGLLVFGLTGAFVVAALAVLLIDRVRRIRATLFSAWIVPLTPKGERATVLSGLSQFDAVGQVGVGPLFGAIGHWASVPAALVASAVVLTPSAAVIASASRADPDASRMADVHPLRVQLRDRGPSRRRFPALRADPWGQGASGVAGLLV